jgi:hypothetical protein
LNRVHAKLEKKETRTVWSLFSLPQTRVAIAAGLVIIVSLYGLREMERNRASERMTDALPSRLAKAEPSRSQAEPQAQSERMEEKVEDLSVQTKLEVEPKAELSLTPKLSDEALTDRRQEEIVPPASRPTSGESVRMDPSPVADQKSRMAAPPRPPEPVDAAETVSPSDRDALAPEVPVKSSEPASGGKALESGRLMAASDELRGKRASAMQMEKSDAVADRDQDGAVRRNENQPLRKDADHLSYALTVVSVQPETVLPALAQAGWVPVTEKREHKSLGVRSGAGGEGAATKAEARFDSQVVNIQIPASSYSHFMAQLQRLGAVSSRDNLPGGQTQPLRALAKGKAISGIKEIKADSFAAGDVAASAPVTNGQEMIWVILTIRKQ